jgi:2-keto-4-pentenoate hydratase/2-oxohepta-3-ene-1,7-dioic acid hydratase in catechol pathway
MKLVSFETAGRKGIGVHLDDGIVDLASDAMLPTDMVEFIALGDEGLARALALVDSGAARITADLLAPVRPRSNVMCVGKNYREHVGENRATSDAAAPQKPPAHLLMFTKAPSSIVGDGVKVRVSDDATKTSDYEGELAVVIGVGGSHLEAADAWRHVYGYTIVNDMTVRELQHRHKQYFIGKSAATYCPMGPWIVTADEFGEVGPQVVRTTVNGEVRQEAPVSQMIFDIPEIIRTVSTTVLLEPGDVIATGTPGGVGVGFDPPRYLGAGDVVEVSIDGIGTLTNVAV